MSHLILSKLSFKPVEKKKPKVTHNRTNRFSKKLYCVCIEESLNNFKAYIDMKNDKEFSDILALPFTEKSYDLKGKTKVFSRNKKGKVCCILRDKLHAKFFPGLPSQYTPFRHNYVYSGYVVTIEGKHYFDVEDIFENVAFCRELVSSRLLKEDNK